MDRYPDDECSHSHGPTVEFCVNQQSGATCLTRESTWVAPISHVVHDS